MVSLYSTILFSKPNYLKISLATFYNEPFKTALSFINALSTRKKREKKVSGLGQFCIF